MTDRPDKAISIDRIVDEPVDMGVQQVASVRAGERFVPGYTNDTDRTHLTRTFFGMTALCGYYPVELCGDSPSGEWCEECLSIADGYEINRDR